MKIFGCLCLCSIAFSVFSTNDEYQPKVYADITKQAEENAVKYDGIKLIGGLGYTLSDYKASIIGRNETTKNSLNHFIFTLGCDYSKALKHNILIGASLLVDMWSRQKKSGNWASLNGAYDNQRGGAHAAGNREAELQNAFLTPEMCIKAGYIFKSLKSSVSLKIGLSREECKYRYRVNNAEVASVNISKFIPLIGISGYRNINSKFGIMVEINKSLGKKAKNNADLVDHQVEMAPTTIRLLGTMKIK